MRRWIAVLIAALYLLPQVAVALHAEEILENCSFCEGEHRGLAFECSDDDCEDDGHHHHRHDRHHHPGNCRVCSAGSEIALERPDDLTAIYIGPVCAPDPVDFCEPVALLRHAIRAPPAR